MIPDTSVGWGPTYLLNSTPKRLSRLRTGQQEVPGTSSKSEALCNPGPILVTTWFLALGDALLSTRVKILHRQSQAYYLRLIIYSCLLYLEGHCNLDLLIYIPIGSRVFSCGGGVEETPNLVKHLKQRHHDETWW